MENRLPRVVIAALRGGAGKTTLAIGLIAAWRERARKVVPFKKGPDYIDAGWLALAAGQPCYNLDPFLMNREQILDSFWERTRQAAGAVIEGNRGPGQSAPCSGPAGHGRHQDDPYRGGCGARLSALRS
jgi:cobyrinic acid a,c-diamide synthase